MQFTALATLLLPVLAAAAPMAATAESWTIGSLSRTCDAADKQCIWRFSVNAPGQATQACAYVVSAAGSAPASQSPESGTACGPYWITSGWSGQWGPGNGFTTLSVVDNARRLVAWPAYTDNQLSGGATVKPDQSYNTQSF